MTPKEVDPTLVPGRIDNIEVPDVASGFGFSEEHELSWKSAQRLMSERCPMSSVRKLADDPRGFDPDLYREMATLGFLGLAVPEELGGSAAGHLHLALLLEEMGRVLLPSPFFPTLVAIETLLASGSDAQKERFVPEMVRGERIATTAFGEPGSDTQSLGVRAEPAGEGHVLSGDATHVLFGADARLVVVAARETQGGVALFAVEAPSPGLAVAPEVSVDTTRRTARLHLENVRAERLASDGPVALRYAEITGAALLACEMVGVADAVLLRTRDYAVERHQFGRAIGSFQAVKHPLVDLMLGVELARNLALGAATLLDRGVAHAEVSARMAKAHASDVLAFGVKKGVQLHGGFGFTWDADVHFFFKRSLYSRPTFGDAIHHRRRLANRLLGNA